MAPETIQSKVNPIEEAGRIKEELVNVQLQVDAAASARQNELLEGVRERLNYQDVAAPQDQNDLVDTRIKEKSTVMSPEALARVLPLTANSIRTTKIGRHAAESIINHTDNRLLVIAGPCSIHDPKATLEYAAQVAEWREVYKNELEIVMRFYNEKPRTQKDWKGLVNDPLLDGSEDVIRGIILSRMLACRITDLGVPLASERLNTHTPQFLNGLIVYDAIGARNAEDQTSREYGSGTSSVLGQKHNQSGDIRSAVNGIVSESSPHAFLGTSETGMLAQVVTTGNETAHLILRGTNSGPNHDIASVQSAKVMLISVRGAEHPVSLIIDASHGNSGGKAKNQLIVVEDVAKQISEGEQAIRGVMIESNLVEGKQSLKNADGSFKDKSELVYGQSITDECVNPGDTVTMLERLSDACKNRRALKAKS